MEVLKKEVVFDTLPKWKVPPHLVDNAAFILPNEVVVVLDDDPTGTQTVHGIPVLTDFSLESFMAEIQRNIALFYVLTNSRSLKESDTIALHKQLAERLQQAALKNHKQLKIISRSDSTLRGHFPAETNALAAVLFENSTFITVLAPAFFEGGRYTLNNIHYVEDGDDLIAAADTSYATDRSFGYSKSNLYDWAIEKSAGSLTSDQIFDISIEDIRVHGAAFITNKIIENRTKKVLIVNATDYTELQVALAGIKQAESKEINFLFRTAASFVPAYSGMDRKAVFQKGELKVSGNPGLIIVGSYVPKTSAQLEPLLVLKDLVSIEIEVTKLIEPSVRKTEIDKKAKLTNEHLQAGRHVVLYTSRKLVSSQSKEQSLGIVNEVSQGVVDIVSNITVEPGFIIAKGGITSSDIATKALQIKRAMVLGQILPGIPVWKPDDQSKFPGVPYIVFPGNVGSNNALFDTFQKLIY
ncbi:MAG: four-carbon acid sugar kinase family protein [Cyclobacteriaceae bacterium]